MKYPKTISENFDFRARILSKSKIDKQFRSAIREIIKNDILFWINTFCWIYDAKGDIYEKLGFKTHNMLFITWDYQDEYILDTLKHIIDGKDLLTEKSRDMGVSWMVLVIFEWLWQFGGVGNDFLIGSRKAESIDKIGMMDSLFPKIRYNLYKQPQFLMPLGFIRSEHDNYMRLINPETNNFIKGEANNIFFGTSGRYKAILKDEFAKWEHTDESAWQSTSDTTNCRLPVSSAFGRDNQFYKLRSKKVGNINIHRLHYTKHPLKNKKWYEKEAKRRSPEDLASEIDIDYSASIKGKAYGSYKYEIHCAKPYPVYNKNLPLILVCDFNINPMSWAICFEENEHDNYFDEIAILGDTRTEFASIEFRDRYKNHKNKVLTIYGDASGKYGSANAKENNYEIIKRILKKAGWQIIFQLHKKNPLIIERINATNKRLCDYENDNKNFIHINPIKCSTIVESIEQTVRQGDGLDKKGNIEHMMEGVSYKCEYQHPIKSRKRKKIKFL